MRMQLRPLPPPKEIISGSVMALNKWRTILAEPSIVSIRFANRTR